MSGVTIDPDARTVSATRSLRASGTSLRLTVPPALLDTIKAGEGDELRLVAHMDSGEIVVSKADAGVGTEATGD